MSVLTTNYLTPTGREEAWRFTPLKRLRGLHDGTSVQSDRSTLIAKDALTKLNKISVSCELQISPPPVNLAILTPATFLVFFDDFEPPEDDFSRIFRGSSEIVDFGYFSYFLTILRGPSGIHQNWHFDHILIIFRKSRKSLLSRVPEM